MKLTDCGQIFEDTGSLHDLYIFDTTVSDWQAVIDWLRTGIYPYTFRFDGEIGPLPEKVASIFANRAEVDAFLSLDIAGMQINCFFFWEGEIEFDLAPREVNSDERLNQLLDFMRRLGRLLHKDVALTEESWQELEYLRYVYAENDIQVVSTHSRTG
jgi:hypothetical protein